MRQDKSPPKLFDYVLHTDSGKTFYLSTDKLFSRKPRSDIDEVIHSAGSVLRLSASFEKRRAEVKYSSDSSLPQISSNLQSLDSGTRLEIFSTESDDDAMIRMLAVESLRSVLFKPGPRLNWSICEIRDYFKRYGTIQEIHYFFGPPQRPNHMASEVLVTFTMLSSANTCVESFQQMRQQLPFRVELLRPSECWQQAVIPGPKVSLDSPQEDTANPGASSSPLCRQNKKRGYSCPLLQRCIIRQRSRYVNCTKVTEEPAFNTHLELMLMNTLQREEMSQRSRQPDKDAGSIIRQRSFSVDIQTNSKRQNFKECMEPDNICTAELLLYSESAEATSRKNILLCGQLHTTTKKCLSEPEQFQETRLNRSFLSASCLSDGISADEHFSQEPEESGPSVAPVLGPTVQLVRISPATIHHTISGEEPSHQDHLTHQAGGSSAKAVSSSKCYKVSRRQPLITFFAFPDEALLCSSPHSSRIETLLNYSPRY